MLSLACHCAATVRQRCSTKVLRMGEAREMTATVASTIILLMTLALVRWIAAVPLVRTLSASIDTWADAVQGRAAEPLI
jgi:hypothetical protein